MVVHHNRRFPGAIPPLIGFAAAANTLTPDAWALFAILFFWQFPHFYAIAWMYREDYARAGIQMLPVVEPDGESTARQILVYSLLLIPISLLPKWLRYDRIALHGRRSRDGARCSFMPGVRVTVRSHARPRPARPARIRPVPAGSLRVDGS